MSKTAFFIENLTVPCEKKNPVFPRLFCKYEFQMAPKRNDNPDDLRVWAKNAFLTHPTPDGLIKCNWNSKLSLMHWLYNLRGSSWENFSVNRNMPLYFLGEDTFPRQVETHLELSLTKIKGRFKHVKGSCLHPKSIRACCDLPKNFLTVCLLSENWFNLVFYGK